MRKNRMVLLAVLFLGPVGLAQKQGIRPLCDDNAPLCTETNETLNYEGQYTGHDEPSVLFYSNTHGRNPVLFNVEVGVPWISQTEIWTQQRPTFTCPRIPPNIAHLPNYLRTRTTR